jgi:hypothetical protein
MNPPPLRPDKKQVRHWRALVRKRIALDTTLRADRKRAPRRSWEQGVPRFARLLPAGALTALAFSSTPLETANLYLTGWLCVLTLFRAARLQTAQATPALLIFFQLPATNPRVALEIWRSTVASVGWTVFDCMVFGITSIQALQLPAAGWTVAALWAVAHGIVSLAFALLLVRAFPRAPYPLAAAVGSIALFVSAHVLDADPAAFAAFGKPLLGGLAAITPAGWLQNGYADALRGNAVAWLVFAAVTGGAIAVVRVFGRRWRARFSLENMSGYTADAVPAPAETDLVASGDGACDPALDVTAAPFQSPAEKTELRAKVKTALAVACEAPAGARLAAGGLPARLAVRGLSLRLRHVADFLQPAGGPGPRRLLLASAVILIAAAAQRFLPSEFSGAIPFIVACALALPAVGGSWGGLAAVTVGTTQVGMHATMPIRFVEIARVYLVTNLVRCACGFPVVFVGAVLLVFDGVAFWREAVLCAAKIVVAVFALQPIWLIVTISRSTNDSSVRRFSGALVCLGVLGEIVLMFGWLLALALIEDEIVALALGAAMIAVNLVALAVYGWMYARGKFDLFGKAADAR